MNWCNNAFPVTMHEGNYHITGLYEWILKLGVETITFYSIMSKNKMYK